MDNQIRGLVKKLNEAENLSESIGSKNYRSATDTYLGYAAVFPRKGSQPGSDVITGANFILNGGNDGWFRGVEGNGKGYGWAAQKVRLSGRKPIDWGQGKVYKIIADGYFHTLDQTGEDIIKNVPYWLFVHRDNTVEEVLSYIKSQKNKWKP